MTVSDFAQGKVFLISLIVGALSVVIFDIFTVLRHKIRRRKAVVNMLDVVCLVLIFLLIFLTGVKINFGALRYYQIIGIALGIILHHALFSKMERHIIEKLFECTIYLTCFLIKIIYKPIMFIMRLFATAFNLIEDKFVKCLIHVKKKRKKQSLKREKNKKTVKKRLKMM